MTAETLAVGDIDDDIDDIAKLLISQLFEGLLMMVIDSWDKGLFSSLITSTHFLICTPIVNTITVTAPP